VSRGLRDGARVETGRRQPGHEVLGGWPLRVSGSQREADLLRFVRPGSERRIE